MIHCPPSDLYKFKYAFLWMLLSFKAGYLNAAGFLATGMFVSHVTGFGTQMGISMTHENFEFGIELLIIPFSYIFGSSVPAWILEKNYSPKLIPKFYQIQFLITLCLGVLYFMGMNGMFGDFSTPDDDTHDIMLAGILCFICGMKNGLTTWATHGKIRTTHLTGLSTDIGLHLPKLFRRNNVCRLPEMRRVNTVRILTFISFSVGSLIAAFIFPNLEFLGLLFPFVLSIVLLGVSYSNYEYFSKKQLMEEV
jgi:uncharacterized membrane protein YoaK (UPF0700 family)